ncbi:MAG: hypothetical protein HDT42_03160 [Ruminococcaceae bacterium]|nr:hypothetical protein [Oscillospiraceae bacterium]
MDEIEYKVYKKRAVFILAAELLIGLALRLVGLRDLFTAVIYSFAVLSVMLLLGWVKNKRIKKDYASLNDLDDQRSIIGLALSYM